MNELGMKKIFALCLLTGPAFAENCPAAPDHSAAQSALYGQLQELRTPVGANDLSDALLQLWTDAPNEKAQALLDQGVRMRARSNLLGARVLLDQLIEYCPDYAEGYNQRAFTNFLAGNLDGALVDLDDALRLNPAHTGAITGKAMTLIRLGRNEEAQILLREAVDLNPWLAARSLIVEPQGTEI